MALTCHEYLGADCVNFEGGFNCTCGFGGFTTSDYRNCSCPQGKMWDVVDSKRICVDINECETGDHHCLEYYEGACLNLDDGLGYNCTCAKGYEGPYHNCTKMSCPNGRIWEDRVCADIDECVDETICSQYDNSFCENSDGSYYCSCESLGDNFVIGTNNSCSCKPGFELVGKYCKDTDECEVWNTCEVTEECRNTPGNFTCIEYTDVLVFKKMKAGLVNFFDKSWIDLKIVFEDKTDSHWSCGILFKNVQYVFGGQNEIRQISKVDHKVKNSSY